MSMKKFALELMPVDDLWSLYEQISEILSARITSKKRELENRLAVIRGGRDVFKQRDASSSENSKARRKYPRVVPKYLNPLTSETWSGRGKRPRWLVAAIKTGHKVEDLKIGGAAGSKGEFSGREA
jgi:DNA-binding protein H-NS